MNKLLPILATAALATAAAAQTCTPAWTFPPGMNANIYAFTSFNDGSGQALFAGGDFSTGGTTPASHVGKWNGTTWSGLGPGVDSTVYSFATFDNGSGNALYVSGGFNNAGGSPAPRVARWNGQSWSPVGSVSTDNCYAICTFNDGTGNALYAAGGLFTPFGSRGFIMKWNGSSWVSIATVNSVVSALASFNDGSGNALYAAGAFTTINGIGAANIAKWDGSQWSALGVGTDGAGVNALAVYDDSGTPALAVAGYFMSAGNYYSPRIAKWSGGAWAGYGQGLPNAALAVAGFDDGTGPALYAAGGVNSGPFGTSSGYVNKWDGASWTPAGGQSFNLTVNALGVHNDAGGGRTALFAGGAFTSTEVGSAQRFARFGCPPLPPCGSADFNCDGDTGTDADIEAFFRCLAGSCPGGTCPGSADFNGDGDTGTDADIEAFFRVLAGGTC